MTDLLEEREAIVKKFPAAPVEVEQQTRCPPAILDATASAMADSKARMDKSRVDEDGPGRTTKRVLSVTKNREGDFSTIDNYSKAGRHNCRRRTCAYQELCRTSQHYTGWGHND